MSAKGMAAAARVGDRLVSGPSTDALGQRGKKKALPRKVRNPQEDAVTAAARAMIGGVLASSAGRDADEARGKLKKKRATTVLAAKLDAILGCPTDSIWQMGEAAGKKTPEGLRPGAKGAAGSMPPAAVVQRDAKNVLTASLRVSARPARRTASSLREIGLPANWGAADRSNPVAKRDESMGGDLLGSSILQKLKAGVLKVPPSKKLVAPKGGSWSKKLQIPTPKHMDWKPPLEYASSSAGTAPASGWTAFGQESAAAAAAMDAAGGEAGADEGGDVSGGIEVFADGLESLLQGDKDRPVPAQARVAGVTGHEAGRGKEAFATPALSFDSRFESGNLARALRRGESEYALFMRDDVCSMPEGHVGEVPHCAQWFYFRVLNARARTPYTLRVVNFVKHESVFTEGLRPLLYSRKEEKNGRGWHRAGEDIQYGPTRRTFAKRNSDERVPFYALSFSLTFPHDDDECFVAMCYPYTYSDLQGHLRDLSACPQRSRLFSRHALARTLAGNTLDLLVISDSTLDLVAGSPSHKRALVMTGRVHPGETNASFMMHGIIDFLLGPSQYAAQLRAGFVIYVVPMLNPDGVILGNYRCSLSGHDLNRAYPAPHAELHPEICAVKKLARELAASQRLAMFMDMHGHSSKKGFFLYCCDPSVVALPAGIERRSAFFSMNNTTFKIGKAKETTGRAVMYSEPMSCVNSYTCEASFLGAELPGGTHCIHFNTHHLRGAPGIHLSTYIDRSIDRWISLALSLSLSLSLSLLSVCLSVCLSVYIIVRPAYT